MKNSFEDSKRQLRIAETHLSSMRTASNFNEFEDSWNIALGALEKAWIKAERFAVEKGIENKFKPWQGKNITERRKDPLLRYLKHARDSDHHSIQESIQYEPAKSVASIEGGRDIHIKTLHISKGEIIQYEGSAPLVITNYPARIRLVNVINQGSAYTPPRSHLGNEIKFPDPFIVLAKGIQYYKNFIDAAEAKFFS